MLPLALSVVPFAFAFLVLFGALTDLSAFRIPNWVSYGLVLLFIVQSFLVWLDTAYLPSLGFRWPPFAMNVVIALMVLLVSVAFWLRGYIGGGDAKYLSSIALWMGPGSVVAFMVLVSILALTMALALKISARWGFIVQAAGLPDFVKRIYAKFEENKLPYGFPIGLAALIMIPELFSS